MNLLFTLVFLKNLLNDNKKIDFENVWWKYFALRRKVNRRQLIFVLIRAHKTVKGCVIKFCGKSSEFCASKYFGGNDRANFWGNFDKKMMTVTFFMETEIPNHLTRWKSFQVRCISCCNQAKISNYKLLKTLLLQFYGSLNYKKALNHGKSTNLNSALNLVYPNFILKVSNANLKQEEG